jgi:hypothetical protein
MKKYAILFALLTGIILLAFEAVPALQVSAQSMCGGKGQPPCPSNPGSSGGPQIPGPKNRKPTPAPTPVPTPVPPQVIGLPTIPVVIPLPTAYPTPYPTVHIPDPVCRIGPCWPLIVNPGDPVELLAGGGFLAFLIVIGIVFFRGRNAAGRGGGPG